VAAFAGDAFQQGTVWRVGDFHAVAIWLAPDAHTNEEQVVSVLREAVAPELHKDMFSVLEQMAQAHPTFQHWYLPWLGVEPEHQGSGLGGRLLQHLSDDGGREPSARVPRDPKSPHGPVL
jgi:ribosomal protein S18 acetylase RimI-like enzyme